VTSGVPVDGYAFRNYHITKFRADMRHFDNPSQCRGNLTFIVTHYIRREGTEYASVFPHI